MGNKVSRWMRNYDAERRALKVLSKQGDSAQPVRAPRFVVEQEYQRKVAADPELDAAVNRKDAHLLENLSHVKVVSSSPPRTLAAAAAQSMRPLPLRRHFVPLGDLGVPDVPVETVPKGRLTLMQFQELLNTRQPIGGLTSAAAEELLQFYAPLMQRTQDELRSLTQKQDEQQVPQQPEHEHEQPPVVAHAESK